VIRKICTLVATGLITLLTACGGGGGGGGSSSSGGGNNPPPDTTPNGYTFTSQADAARSAAVTSNEVTISGITAGASITIAGGEYSIDGGAFTAAAGTVTNNQRVRVRVTTSAQFSTGSTATLTVGGVSGAFTATTLAADTTPAAFEFAKIANAARGSWASSASATITGINTDVAVTIANGEYSIAGGAFTTAPGTIGDGQTIVVRALAGTGYSRATRATLTVGTVTVEFEIVTELPSYQANDIAYDDQDVVYLLSNQHHLVFRWSVREARYLDAWPVGTASASPTQMTYSAAHGRLYFGYSNGSIRSVAVAGSDHPEIPFATLPLAVAGLEAAGNFVLAQDYSGAWATHYVLNASGAIADQQEWNHVSPNSTWDPVSSRYYYFSMWSPADLNYEQIDQTTGAITGSGETPYHGSYSILGPIRVSPDGAHVLLGSGDIYARTGLTWSGSLGGQVQDARWAADNSLVTLRTSANQTLLRRLATANLATLEQITYTGQALRVAGTDTRMAVFVFDGTTVRVHTYMPSDDSDGDGVANTQDAFPLDVAASVDTDRDGRPDAWNTGRTQADSTTNLVIDAFPQDSACWLADHGSGGLCNYGATIPNYTPDQIAQHGDVVYLLSSANRRVYRWSIAAGAYLNPYVVGINNGFSTVAPTKMTYSPAHQRIYLGYDTGAIRYLDATSNTPVETAFANISIGVQGLGAVGNYLLAQDYSGAWATHYIINAAGVITDSEDWNYYSPEYAWDPTTSRVYFIRASQSPSDLHYEIIDQGTGQITGEGEAPYHGSYAIQAPVRVSANGQYVLLGSGDLYVQNGLTWTGSLGSAIGDARWFANGSLALLTTSGNQTTLRRLGSNTLTTLEQRTYVGQALRVVGSDTRMAVLVMNAGTVQFHVYQPSDDSDGDGVINTQDAFPLDIAAAVDTDRDGHPDAWNAGRGQADSTTGLSLDAFANDAACWLPAHGAGGICDYGATVPNYLPDAVALNGDTVYLLSSANRRVYRRSIATGQYLNPYIVGTDQGYSTVSPTSMAYSPAHQRIYLGYSTGAVRYIDITAGTPVETIFATVPNGAHGLTSAGNFLLVHDSNGYYGTTLVYAASGALVTNNGPSASSRDYAWDPNSSRVYWLRDGISPNDLHYSVIDQTSGLVTSGDETPYHGSYSIEPPIRVSANGALVLLGSGHLYARTGLTWVGSLGTPVADARWMADGSLVAVLTSGNQTTLRRLGGDGQTVLEQRSFAGQALRLIGSDTAMVLLTADNGLLRFHNYVPSNDSDGDGVSNTLDAFPLDVAASVDTDRDGRPNAWNAGRSAADSTTGLTLDAFPNDSACWSLAHGAGGNCNYAATLPNYVPDEIVTHGDTVYLLSATNRRVYRFSIATGQHLNPYVVGIDQGFATIGPTKMTYSAAHDRLYLGYETGAIRYIDVTGAGAEVPFSNTAMAVGGLVATGNYLLAEDGSGAWATHYVFDAAGAITDQEEWNYTSEEYTWDPVHSRVYFFRQNMSPGDLHFEVVDQTTGTISAEGETPYHGDFQQYAPIRVSPDGEEVLVGPGAFYDRATLTLVGGLPGITVDAVWKDDLLVTLDSADRVSIRDADSHVEIHDYSYADAPLRLAFGTNEAYLIHVQNGTTAFLRLPFYDQDGDGIARWWEDRFGFSDSAAGDGALDGDGDGASNTVEYQNHTNPTLSDSDGDGLNDNFEIVTHGTNPNRVDSDGDDLNDGPEVLTHNTDPLDADSDNDGYIDFIEIRLASNPNDAASLPLPMTSYGTSFNWAGTDPFWTTPPATMAPWSRDLTLGRTDSVSYKSGTVGHYQASGTRMRSRFAAGTLRFYARVEADSCCDVLQVVVDGTIVSTTYATAQWVLVSVPITAGLHEIEWRYQKDSYAYQSGNAAWIDDVTFAQ
jgi:hypothetical protein